VDALSVLQDGPLIDVCAWCRDEGTVAEPEGANISHGLCTLHAELWALEERLGIWNPAKWPAAPPRIALPFLSGAEPHRVAA